MFSPSPNAYPLTTSSSSSSSQGTLSDATKEAADGLGLPIKYYDSQLGYSRLPSAASPILGEPTDEEAIKSLCGELASGNWNEHMAEGSYIVRPSGNFLTKDEEAAMRASDDIVMEKEELLEIHDVDVMGDLATATFTVYQKFAYKGAPQDDVSVMLVILKRDKDNGSGAWKLTGGARSQGRPPSDPKPAFP